MPTKPPSAKFAAQDVITGKALIMLVLLLVLPGVVLFQLAGRFDWRIVLSVPLLMSLGVFFLYRSDKRRAENQVRRIPESTLHLGEILGGWPGAFLAQRRFRHKTRKVSYQITFWLIVALHEYASLDFLLNGKATRGLFHWIGHFFA